MVHNQVDQKAQADFRAPPGHEILECKNPRKIDRSTIRDVSPDEAIKLMKEAVQDRDVDDAKEAVQMYVKITPETTYTDLEKLFREFNIGIYLIGIEKEHKLPSFTNMDLQGNLEKKYTVTYRFSPSCPRPRERELWPADGDENLNRLADAGEITERLLSKCSNCSELGHTSKFCKEDKQENSDRPTVWCFNCDTEGHRVRDCECSITSVLQHQHS